MDTCSSQNPSPRPVPQAGLARLSSDSRFPLRESAAGFPREERLHRLTQMMDRLIKVERQNHKILVLIFALTITAFIFLLIETSLFPEGGVVQLTQSISAGPPGLARGTNAVPPRAGGNYLGVKTSSEYHRPDCPAVRTEVPGALQTFESAKAAREQGYKPCPVCRPPEAD